MRVVLQMGLSRHPKFPDIPNALELAPDEKGRSAFELLFAQLALGRPILASPGVPAEQANILRKAFAETMRDPEFLADAQKLKLETRWFGPERMDKVMLQMTKAPGGHQSGGTQNAEHRGAKSEIAPSLLRSSVFKRKIPTCNSACMERMAT